MLYDVEQRLHIIKFIKYYKKGNQMGNKIGFQIDSQTVKLAYVQSQEQNIKFILNLKSKYLKAEIQLDNSIIFLFQCTVSEFIDYHSSQNAVLLRDKYKKLLDISQLVICTNRATINTLKQNKCLSKAMIDVIMKQFKLQHTQRIQNSVNAMNILQKNQQQFFYFKQNFNILQLNHFQSTFTTQKILIDKLPNKFLLVILRNGMSAYLIEQGKIQRIQGSIVGQNTFTSILKYKYPECTIQQCFQLAFKKGNAKNVDLLVQDIYGKNASNFNLPAEIIASSMGKYGKMNRSEIQNIKKQDIMRSLITTFAINTANLTALYLKTTQLQNAIVLADNFHNDIFYILVQSITKSYAPGVSIYFAHHSPFMGCLGTAFTNCLL